MNLLDIRSKDWSEICLDATAPQLGRLLGAPVPSTSVLVRLFFLWCVFVCVYCSDVVTPLCPLRVLYPPTLCSGTVSLRAAGWWPLQETTQVRPDLQLTAAGLRDFA